MARIWSEIEALNPTEPERALIDACKAGSGCWLGDGTLPDRPDPDRTIRAEVLRYLILGGCDACRVHEQGVRMLGAYVSGKLDLSYAKANGPTMLAFFRFQEPIVALQTWFETLNLTDSVLPGLNAQGVRVAGNVFLRGGFTCEGEVSLSGAEIGGQLACEEGTFRNPGGIALSAQRVRVSGSLLLSDGFTAEGQVSLSGAEIGGQLDCEEGMFHNPGGIALNAQGVRLEGDLFLSAGFTAGGEVSLTGTEIGGQLICELGEFRNAAGKALMAQRLRVGEGFIWRRVDISSGAVDLASAQVGDLVDDMDSWPVGRVNLDGFTYQRISAAFTDTESRLEWLRRGTVWSDDFYPQPYSQLAKVLREMGHERAARRVRIEQRRLTMLHDWRRAHRALDGTWRARWRRLGADLRGVSDGLQRVVVGYGWRPFLSLVWLAGLWLMAAFLARMAWSSGAMVPNSDVILTSPGWQAVEGARDAALTWSETVGRDWTTFNPVLWGFDTVVPIIEVGQTGAWAPSPARGGWGQAAFWGQWLLSIAGWIVAALAAAAVTGLIRRDDE
ncbi:hypothetical protein JI664_01790 [Rhodobacter sp. NTK016B]|uniref:hypothetical protein n=1 Tax=Rhodobacter sp. NTK016B TaxID=2759676 RepID=UPI001A8E04F5|nr:hypothetical protein [Rhodobacter sp. NTK016B]MBN8290685.1 hypothetical protein [Rhodobacter sp. NTK016B]